MRSESDTEWLASLAEQRFKPAVIYFDGENRITAIAGDPAFYGYSEPVVGDEITEAFDFMFGANLDSEFALDFVETPNQLSIHVFVQLADEKRALTLVDATGERDQHQALQQGFC